MLERGADLLEEPSGPTAQIDRAREARRPAGGARADERGAPPSAGPADRLPAPTACRARLGARSGLPGAGAQLADIADRSEHRLAAAAERRSWMSVCSAAGRRASSGRSPRAQNGLPRTSSVTRCGCTTAFAGDRARAGRARCRISRASSIPSGSCSGRSPCCGRTRSVPARNVVRGLVGPPRASSSAPAAGAGRHRHDAVWWLLPVAVLFAGFAPAAISFASVRPRSRSRWSSSTTSRSRRAGGWGCCASRTSRSAAA